MSVIVSGIKPSGALHLGNHVGMIRPILRRVRETDDPAFHFVADLHALTTLPDPGELEGRVLDAVASLLAVGVDPERSPIFRQSDVPEIPRLAWILSCVTPMGELERGHAYKDAIASGDPVRHGLFAYPLLMAADILAVRADLVPVGRDQAQHLEMTRSAARRFHRRYGRLFPLPRGLVEGDPLPGIDGRKMSKSYGNTIPLTASGREIRDRVRRIVTDSSARDEARDPQASVVYRLYRAFAGDEDAREMREALAEGRMGWKEAKDRLGELLDRELGPIRSRFRELRSDRGTLASVLAEGAERAGRRARETLELVHERVGLAGRTESSERRAAESRLDAALDGTFPASDPIAPYVPGDVRPRSARSR